ncbi:MAG: hypothetical protein ACK2T6_02045, partial [Anaerolineae bacterium]
FVTEVRQIAWDDLTASPRQSFGLLPAPTPVGTATATPPTPTEVPPTATEGPTPTEEATATEVSPTSTIVPPTATEPATATSPPPTVTPVSTPDGCVRPLLNPGFERDGAWTLRGGRTPRYIDHMSHSGDRSMLLGILSNEPNQFSYSTIWQAAAVPGDATTMTVSAWTYQAAQPGGGADRQLMLVYDIDPDDNLSGQHSPIAYVFGERVDANEWQRRTLTIDVTEYRGSTLWLYSTVVNDGLGGRVWMALDDLEVKYCP